jgi:hypothetical protein
MGQSFHNTIIMGLAPNLQFLALSKTKSNYMDNGSVGVLQTTNPTHTITPRL